MIEFVSNQKGNGDMFPGKGVACLLDTWQHLVLSSTLLSINWPVNNWKGGIEIKGEAVDKRRHTKTEGQL